MSYMVPFSNLKATYFNREWFEMFLRSNWKYVDDLKMQTSALLYYSTRVLLWFKNIIKSAQTHTYHFLHIFHTELPSDYE